jgi:hypothetical protein
VRRGEEEWGGVGRSGKKRSMASVIPAVDHITEELSQQVCTDLVKSRQSKRRVRRLVWIPAVNHITEELSQQVCKDLVKSRRSKRKISCLVRHPAWKRAEPTGLQGLGQE